VIRPQLQVEFLPTQHGRIFVVARRPAIVSGKGVLIVPPFAEEMNKSRRMIALLAAQLAAKGIPTLCVDLLGTGDSEGEFREARWEQWCADLEYAMRWAQTNGLDISQAVGVRLGCLLLADCIRRSELAMERLVFWQPVMDGKRFIEQFLRLRVAAQLANDQKETVAELRARIANGEIIEVAGYELSNELVSAIERTKATDVMEIKPCSLEWMEIVRSAAATAPPPTAKTIESLSGKGFDIRLRCVVSEPFWSSVEIVTCAELIDASVTALSHAA
jgi:exosortase A-associated hydrolase 2